MKVSKNRGTPNYPHFVLFYVLPSFIVAKAQSQCSTSASSASWFKGIPNAPVPIADFYEPQKIQKTL